MKFIEFWWKQNPRVSKNGNTMYFLIEQDNSFGDQNFSGS